MSAKVAFSALLKRIKSCDALGEGDFRVVSPIAEGAEVAKKKKRKKKKKEEKRGKEEKRARRSDGGR
jgi:hypothetical protein